MRGLKSIGDKRLGEMAMNKGGGIINWFPGHMAAASRAIRDRLKLSDLVLDIRDARIPLSSRNENLEALLCGKRRVIALNKKDLANPNILPKWVQYFESTKQDCLAINAHSKSSVNKLLHLVEMKLKEVVCKQPTLLVMVVGVPNVGKSALINSIHQISSACFPVQENTKRATVGPLPGVTQDIAGYKIAHRPSIYVLDTPGVLVPSIQDIETGLKLAAAGSVKDSVVGEERIAQYVLAVLNTRGTTLHWKHLTDKMDQIQNASEGKHDNSAKDLLSARRKLTNNPDVHYVEDVVSEVQRALSEPLVNFGGNIDDENDMENLIEQQFEGLQRAFKVPHNASEGRTKVSKRFLTLFRSGKLGPFILDDVPEF